MLSQEQLSRALLVTVLGKSLSLARSCRCQLQLVKWNHIGFCFFSVFVFLHFSPSGCSSGIARVVFVVLIRDIIYESHVLYYCSCILTFIELSKTIVAWPLKKRKEKGWICCLGFIFSNSNLFSWFDSGFRKSVQHSLSSKVAAMSSSEKLSHLACFI